ncbi:MAG: zf-HC2 domain-containing protein [Treponema sp.]|jgi:anti-sigma factor RsiW|nr:zf-HC2 domain-containing protein [Treponema sp.]
MCPDRQILSVYFDGELNSPWKEKLENHLQNCSPCRGRLESYRVTRQRLAAGTDLSAGAAMERAMARVWEKTYLAGENRAPRYRRGEGGNFWTGYIAVPIPVAAAAGLVMILALAALIILRQPVRAPAEPQLAGMEVQDLAPVSDMASVLQYLGTGDSSDMVIIRLPGTTFKNAGEPQMLRAADYSRAGAGGGRDGYSP